jgi:hypothetical protein
LSDEILFDKIVFHKLLKITKIICVAKAKLYIFCVTPALMPGIDKTLPKGALAHIKRFIIGQQRNQIIRPDKLDIAINAKIKNFHNYTLFLTLRKIFDT